MPTTQVGESDPQQPLRLWPGVVIVVLQWLAWYAVPIVLPDATLYGVLGGFVGGLAVFAWWAFFSRAPRLERWGAVVLVIVAIAATPRLLHESVARGNMGLQFFLYAIPVLSLAFVLWAVATRRLSTGPRRTAMVATILLACGVFALVRSEGVTGDGFPEFAWRWAQTPEERLLSQAADEPPAISSAPATEAAPEEPPPAQADNDRGTPVSTPGLLEPAVARRAAPPGDEPASSPPAPTPTPTAAEWPGLRGPHRDGVLPGIRIDTDWSSSPPVELWRRPIGPGVSSFAVRGSLLYTHEQRGEDEIVACHDVTTGAMVWRHRDASRFWDSHVGAGPRATPAVGDGRVYTLGATGILNALDATDGAVLWSRNAASDTGAELPTWGFVSSPLVVDDVVVVHAGTLVAYDLATGEPRWHGSARGGSYSSPHLVTLGGVRQILLVSDAGAVSVAPADGALLWEHSWPGIGIVQPALTPEGDLLISMIDSGAVPIGTRRIAVAHGPGGWTTAERWTSIALKPSFSPLVVHGGHAYGFDGRLLACSDVEDGVRKWKGGRYGSGQLLLLPDQDLLLVVSEQGDLALVRATPDQFTELARLPAIEGKTWNQPALVGDVLLVRNGQEMAAFRLSLVGG